jgi:NAD(P)-dependent dehydrogenase (short-subunit alcohol dehydrogenase family)
VAEASSSTTIGAHGERVDFDSITASTGNAALMAFSRALGSRSLADGIRVIGVNPGPVETDRLVSIFKALARDQLGDESRYRELMVKFPMGRAATPREIADTMVFLASDRSSYTSGVIVDDRRRFVRDRVVIVGRGNQMEHIEMQRPLQGKVALITGAGRGIGQALAQAYAAPAPPSAARHGRRPRCRQRPQAIEAAGGTALAVTADVSDEASVSRMVEAAVNGLRRPGLARAQRRHRG